MILSFLQVSCHQSSLLHRYNCTITFPCCPLCCLGLTHFSPNLSFLFCFQFLLPGEITEFPLHCHKSAGAQHQPNREICSHSYPRLPTLYSETQHFSSSVIHMSDFPLQNKTTSNSLVLRLSLHLREKNPCSPVQLRSFPAEFFLQSLFQLLSELHLPFPCSVEIKEGGC